MKRITIQPKLIAILFVLPLVIASGSCFYAIRHNQDMAAIKAIEFAKEAFIEQNYDKAFGLLSAETQKHASVEKLKELCMQVNPSSSPTIITATEFEPVHGQKAIKIFLNGENKDEKFYYTFVMLGTADSEYSVVAFYRHDGAFPPAPFKESLRVQRSTKDLPN